MRRPRAVTTHAASLYLHACPVAKSPSGGDTETAISSPGSLHPGTATDVALPAEAPRQTANATKTTATAHNSSRRSGAGNRRRSTERFVTQRTANNQLPARGDHGCFAGRAFASFRSTKRLTNRLAAARCGLRGDYVVVGAGSAIGSESETCRVALPLAVDRTQAAALERLPLAADVAVVGVDNNECRLQAVRWARRPAGLFSPPAPIISSRAVASAAWSWPGTPSWRANTPGFRRVRRWQAGRADGLWLSQPRQNLVERVTGRAGRDVHRIPP
jgi:hypothetical protein